MKEQQFDVGGMTCAACRANVEKCVLKYAEQWNLGEDFINWIKAENIFCSTLVDRIVTGYPRNEAAAICEELGYKDNLIDTGEIFGFWVIEDLSQSKTNSRLTKRTFQS